MHHFSIKFFSPFIKVHWRKYLWVTIILFLFRSFFRSFMHFLTGVCAIIGGVFTGKGLCFLLCYTWHLQNLSGGQNGILFGWDLTQTIFLNHFSKQESICRCFRVLAKFYNLFWNVTLLVENVLAEFWLKLSIRSVYMVFIEILLIKYENSTSFLPIPQTLERERIDSKKWKIRILRAPFFYNSLSSNKNTFPLAFSVLKISSVKPLRKNFSRVQIFLSFCWILLISRKLIPVNCRNFTHWPNFPH